jgi:hypothetical protein
MTALGRVLDGERSSNQGSARRDEASAAGSEDRNRHRLFARDHTTHDRWRCAGSDDREPTRPSAAQ